jgi:hypothetical protein
MLNKQQIIAIKIAKEVFLQMISAYKQNFEK